MQLFESAKTPRLLTVAEYMASNIPGHTELIGGLIYDVSPRNPPHMHAVRVLLRALARGLSDDYMVQVQDPIAIAGWLGKHAPEVDVAVIAMKDYAQTPTAADAFALIEVSDSTYKEDRTDKIPLYVSAAVPTWHLNIPARQVEYYPIGGDLDNPRIFTERDSLEILGVLIPVADLLNSR